MLGSTDPDLRDGVAYPVLATWIERGVYDDLLAGLGDGMAAGMTIGLGQIGTDTRLPAQLLHADPRRVHRPRQPGRARGAAPRCSSGATG